MRERIDAIIKKLSLKDADAERVLDAFEFAESAHLNQKRKGGEPYITHPVAVAEMLADMGLDADTVIAGLLHDVIEDTSITFAEIKSRFGLHVAELTDGVTKLTRLPYDTTKEEEEMGNLRKMFLAMASDIRVIIIKLFDRLHNMRTLSAMIPDKQREISLETMLIYAPIAHRLGMNSVKNELEDLSLFYLDPVGYGEITDFLESSADERNTFLSTIIERVNERLRHDSINAKVEGRVKHIYGIYRKVYMMNRDISEVYDIYAIRVIIETVADCYNVLGLVHDLFRPIPGRFKDYISTPKPNMYRSLHTTVIGREGKPFEVQIRTYEMHRTAEYGIAAHWKYKEGISETGDEKKFAWVRQLLEAQQDEEAEDFIKNLRIELFTDEVFVFTPKGDVINLPQGATPIDFAYTIHSAVGNRMVGAKANGHIVQLDYKLVNGDIVEILTSNSAKGPSRDWLKIAQTGEARNKIKQWFKKEKREENIQEGKAELEAELKREFLFNDFARDEIRENVLRRLSFQNIEDLYAVIGYGGLSVKKVISRISEDVAKQNKSFKLIKPTSKHTKSNSGVLVEGVDNCLIKFARCCTPIPGDDIIGFVTKGYGISVHRTDCPNVRTMASLPENNARLMPVYWDLTEHESDKSLVVSGKKGVEKFQSALTLSGQRRIGLLADIANTLFDMRIEVIGLTAKENADGSAAVEAILNLSNSEQLQHVVLKLKHIKGVTDVTRSIR